MSLCTKSKYSAVRLMTEQKKLQEFPPGLRNYFFKMISLLLTFVLALSIFVFVVSAAKIPADELSDAQKNDACFTDTKDAFGTLTDIQHLVKESGPSASLAKMIERKNVESVKLYLEPRYKLI